MTDGVAEIRPLAASGPDAGAGRRLLGVLLEACFEEPHGEAGVATLLAAPGCRALVAWRESRPAGYVILRNAADEAEILSLGVVPAARRRGVGRALLAAALSAAAAAGAVAVFLEVGEDNAAARALYAAAGFVPVGRRMDYYSRDGRSRVAAVIMRKSLGKT